jgi:hypothetical protein
MTDLPVPVAPPPNVAAPSSTRRRVVVTVVSLTLAAVLAFGTGHAGEHALQNLIVPGLGLYETGLVAGVAVFVLAVAAVVWWVQWGVDWAPAAVVVGSSIAAAVVAEGHHATATAATAATAAAAAGPAVARAAHEFPLVVVVVTGVVWLRGVVRRLPVVRSIASRRVHRAAADGSADPAAAMSVVDRPRAAALMAMGAASADEREASLRVATDPAVVRRAVRIGVAARARSPRRGLAVDHAAPRAALLLSGALDHDAVTHFLDDCRRSRAGVPASEPTWVRLLDGTLAAVAARTAGDDEAPARWAAMLAGPLALRRGHRPVCWWTPLGVRIGSAPLWEQTAATAIARAQGWIGDDDWAVLRPRLLGAAARGVAHIDDERAIAAGRLWLACVDDEQAARILTRPTVQHDPLAVALDRLATRVAADGKDLVA